MDSFEAALAAAQALLESGHKAPAAAYPAQPEPLLRTRPGASRRETEDASTLAAASPLPAISDQESRIAGLDVARPALDVRLAKQLDLENLPSATRAALVQQLRPLQDLGLLRLPPRQETTDTLSEVSETDKSLPVAWRTTAWAKSPRPVSPIAATTRLNRSVRASRRVAGAHVRLPQLSPVSAETPVARQQRQFSHDVAELEARVGHGDSSLVHRATMALRVLSDLAEQAGSEALSGVVHEARALLDARDAPDMAGTVATLPTLDGAIGEAQRMQYEISRLNADIELQMGDLQALQTDIQQESERMLALRAACDKQTELIDHVRRRSQSNGHVKLDLMPAVARQHDRLMQYARERRLNQRRHELQRQHCVPLSVYQWLEDCLSDETMALQQAEKEIELLRIEVSQLQARHKRHHRHFVNLPTVVAEDHSTGEDGTDTRQISRSHSPTTTANSRPQSSGSHATMGSNLPPLSPGTTTTTAAAATSNQINPAHLLRP